MATQFSFLATPFAEQHQLVAWAEANALSAPGPAILHARKALESAVKWMYRYDPSLRQPYEDKLNALLNEPSFKALGNGQPFHKAKVIQLAGNRAAHESKEPSRAEAVDVVSALYSFFVWFAHTYAPEAQKPDPSVPFNPHGLMALAKAQTTSLKERQELEERLDAEAAAAAAARQREAELAKTVEELEAERARLVAEVAAAKKAAEQAPVGEQDWSELETRQYKIDLLLREAGWRLDDERDREFEVVGMPGGKLGYVDYVLWGDDGLPLAVVEAKKALASPLQGQQQAKLYADCLQATFGQRPVIFYSNGFEHWLWDDAYYPPRRVQGFLTKDELALLVQRRATRVPLHDLAVDTTIADRYYQQRAIRAIGDHFETDRQRKSLLVLATGTGKTRTTIALVDLLMRAGWVKRVLFLADRTALVNQAVGAFKAHLPDSAPVNLVTEGHEDGRVYVSTYQTMVGKIDEYRPDGTRRFGVGHFDLVVIDEAHRSVYRKYRGIFDYFDSLLVGLTATPREEVDKNTYDLFDLEPGVPTDAYSLEEAVEDGYLVPPKGVSVPLRFVREGIHYDELPEQEKDEWDSLEWGEDEDGNELEPPDAVAAEAVNKFLFNADTVDKVLETLMTQGVRVSGGDRLGQTIIFAKNQRHADFIYERFVANYPHLDGGNFARVITHRVNYAQTLIEDFSIPEKAPHLAISVDMLDTGIDVPEVVNLVFFKLVRSKTKFWQMLGRGTRLRPGLFGPDDDKTHFAVFDFCQNLEYFSQEIAPAEPSSAPPLSEQLFRTRLQLVRVLDGNGVHPDLRRSVADVLHTAVASMNSDNFLVRPHLQTVERFRDRAAWDSLDLDAEVELGQRVAGLPTQLDPEHVDAKRYDLLLLRAQLARVQGEPFEAVRQRIVQIASALEDQKTIPTVAEQLDLLQDVQAEGWWVDVTLDMLEELRRKTRLLVPLIERSKKNLIYTDFTDELGEATEVDLVPGTSFAQFRKKAESFLNDHLADDIVAKVRTGEPLTADDHADLQRVLVAAGVGDDASFAEASKRAGSFGRFIRSLVGLDRNAVKERFADLLDEKRWTIHQIRWVNLVVDELTVNGVVDASRVYESPYDALAPGGPEDLFDEQTLDEFFAALEELTKAAG